MLSGDQYLALDIGHGFVLGCVWIFVVSFLLLFVFVCGVLCLAFGFFFLCSFYFLLEIGIQKISNAAERLHI